MLKFPYGIADFHSVVTEGYFYADRTACIPHIEDAGKQLLFLRPRRFGKSLLLSMLENYYDLKKAGEFERLFGGLAIGRQPTPLHNQYFVMKWDFSTINAHGDAAAVEASLHNYLNARINDFAVNYAKHLPQPIQIHPTDALSSFQSLLTAVRQTPHKLYLLIDEYDNFANEMLMAAPGVGLQRYLDLLRGEGLLKTVFKNIKAAAAGGGLHRVFITGVSPLVMSDMTSGYNVAENIYFTPEFEAMCGFTEAEIGDALKQVAAHCDLSESAATAVLNNMRLHYNGYRFSTTQPAQIYNPTLALYFLKHFQKYCKPPESLLDSNLEMDRNKLAYIAGLPGGAPVIVQALHDETSISLQSLAERFGVSEMQSAHKDTRFMLSLLYYFGVLTLAGHDRRGKLQLAIPNLVTRKLYLARLEKMLLPEATDRIEGEQAAEALYGNGDLQPLCDFIEQRYFKVFSNRDYLHANELTLKTALLTLLFNETLYIMDSETPVGRRYADLTLIIRPDARQYSVFDLLVECKFIKLGDLGLSGAEAQALSRDELAALPLVREKLAEARAQAPAYRREVEERYRNTMSMELRLRAYAVVSLGFERLVWEELAA